MQLRDEFLFRKNLFQAVGRSVAREIARNGAIPVARTLFHTHFHDYDVLVKTSPAAELLGAQSPELAGLTFHRAADQSGVSGGLYPKVLLEDQHGDRWLFKTPPPGREYKALGEVAASQVWNDIGIPTPAVYLSRQEIDGQLRVGTLQRMVGNVVGNPSADPTRLTSSQLDQLLASHIGRWVLADHDAKPGNFLLLSDGSLQAIDPGNVFRYFPEDGLDRHYEEYGSHSLYNRVWNAYVHGQIDLDLEKAMAVATRVRDLDERGYRAALHPYAQARYDFGSRAEGLGSAADFLDAAIVRKRNIVRDLSQFYASLERERHIRSGST